MTAKGQIARGKPVVEATLIALMMRETLLTTTLLLLYQVPKVLVQKKKKKKKKNGAEGNLRSSVTGCNLLFLPIKIIILNHWKVSTRHVIQNEWNTTEHFVRSGPKTKTDFCIKNLLSSAISCLFEL